jgi:iron-sulfur cluster repair protein YtfE (RIC family)
MAMTTTATEGQAMIRSFLEHEHGELTIGLNQLHELAEQLSSLSVDRLLRRISTTVEWLEGTVAPHMTWEERWLFPQIDDRARTPWATRLVRFDHQQIVEQIHRLRAHRVHLEHGPTSEAIVEVRGDLYALEALLRACLEREERVLLPLFESDDRPWTAGWAE